MPDPTPITDEELANLERLEREATASGKWNMGVETTEWIDYLSCLKSALPSLIARLRAAEDMSAEFVDLAFNYSRMLRKKRGVSVRLHHRIKKAKAKLSMARLSISYLELDRDDWRRRCGEAVERTLE